MKNRIFKICMAMVLLVAFSNPSIADEYVFVLPKSVQNEDDKQMLLTAATNAFLAIPAGDNIRIMNGFDRKTYVKFVIPSGKAYKYPKVRKKQFKSQLLTLEKGVNSLLIDSDAEPRVLLPQFLAHLSTEVFANDLGEDDKVNVIIYGDALYHDQREPAFNMLNGFFPSDGHIRESQKRSIFGTLEKRNKLKNFYVHFVHSNQYDDWLSDLHKNRIERFWGLYLAAMGGQLVTFSPDLSATLDRFLVSGMNAQKQYSYDQSANKVEMLKVWREQRTRSTTQIGVDESLDRPPSCLSDDIQVNEIPPVEDEASNVIVGIRWSTDDCLSCDLDLYATVGSGKWLYYRNKEENFGQYFKDFQSATNLHGLEFVQITDKVKFSDIKAMVNFYSGKAKKSAKGVIRVCFNGNTYEKNFEIEAASGNKGKDINEVSSGSKFWNVVNIPSVLNQNVGGNDE